MRWLVRILCKFIAGSIGIGGMIVVTFDFLTYQDFGATLIKFAILSVVVGVVVSLSNHIVDWTYRAPARRRPAPQPVYKPPPKPKPLSVPEPVPQAPQRTAERRFAPPPLVQQAQPVTRTVNRSMDDRLSRFVEDGQRMIISRQKPSNRQK